MRLESDNLERLQRLSALLVSRLDPARVSLADAARLSMYRSLPVAQLGLTLLQKRAAFDASETDLLMQLTQAECAALGPDIAAWLRQRLEHSASVRSECVLDFLDSKHADVRALGWAWLQESPWKDDPAVWHKLLESPYDDIKGPLVEQLAQRVRDADADTVRLLGAGVLLNLYGGGRYKPGVVAQVVTRLNERPDETPQLLPLLAIAVRSLRGPEFRSGLTGVVSLLEEKPELRASIARRFPELVV